MLTRVYMQVTKDKYQLPLAIANTIFELSKITGEQDGTIRTNIRRYECGEQEYPRFLKVDIDTDDLE